MIWHSTETENVIANFNVNIEKGLPTGVADQHIEEYGQNIVNVTKKTSLKDTIIGQTKSYSNMLVIISSLLSFVVYLLYDNSKWYFPVLSLAVLAFYIAMNVFSLKRCEKVIDTMKHKATPKVTVLRDGIIKKIDSVMLVPGDILILEQGDYVAADARLIEANELRCDEKFVTGEEVAAEKNANIILEDIADIKQRINMVYCGSNVISGSGKAIVTETGMNSQIGKEISVLNEFDSANIEIKEQFTLIGKFTGILLLLCCILVFAVSVAINFHSSGTFAVMLSEAFLNSAALLISVLPEGLPIVAGISLSLSVLQLLNEGILIKNLDVFNKLSDVTVICADKTGILTKNDMSVVSVYNGLVDINADNIKEDSAACSLLRLASLCTNQSNEDRDSVMYNDPTELAIINCCMDAVNGNIDTFYSDYPRVCKIPFNPERKIMTSVNVIDGNPVAIVKGAPDFLLSMCIDANVNAVEEQIKIYTESAFRVIAVAYKRLSEIPANPTSQELECNLQFVGLIALEDNLQNDIVWNIEECRLNGIQTKMLTGDHSDTAKATARRLGILKNDNLVINGLELEEISDDELSSNLSKYSVFARISPADKERIVNLLKNKGELVAVTGDSVNDAPALKLADVGIAMGESGTDVARGAADIILNNNSYSSIIKSINASKKLICTLRRAATYLFGCNIGEFLAIIIGLIAFKKFPVIALQLLFINLLTDSFPVFSIISDSVKNNVPLSRVKNDAKIFNTKSALTIAIQSITIAIVTIVACAFGITENADYSQTTTFLALIFTQLFNMFTAKTETYFFRCKHFIKSTINVALIIVPILVTIMALTSLGSIIGLTAIPFSLFIKCLLLSSLVLVSGELTKLSITIYKRLSVLNGSKTN